MQFQLPQVTPLVEPFNFIVCMLFTFFILHSLFLTFSYKMGIVCTMATEPFICICITLVIMKVIWILRGYLTPTILSSICGIIMFLFYLLFRYIILEYILNKMEEKRKQKIVENLKKKNLERKLTKENKEVKDEKLK